MWMSNLICPKQNPWVLPKLDPSPTKRNYFLNSKSKSTSWFLFPSPFISDDTSSPLTSNSSLRPKSPLCHTWTVKRTCNCGLCFHSCTSLSLLYHTHLLTQTLNFFRNPTTAFLYTQHKLYIPHINLQGLRRPGHYCPTTSPQFRSHCILAFSCYSSNTLSLFSPWSICGAVTSTYNSLPSDYQEAGSLLRSYFGSNVFPSNKTSLILSYLKCSFSSSSSQILIIVFHGFYHPIWCFLFIYIF